MAEEKLSILVFMFSRTLSLKARFLEILSLILVCFKIKSLKDGYLGLRAYLMLSKIRLAKPTAVPKLWRSFGLKPKNWRAEPSSQIGGGHETSIANTLAAFTALLLPSLFCSITLPPAQQPPLPTNSLLLHRHFSRPPPLISSVACASPEAPPVHGIPQSITCSYRRLKGHILSSLPS